MGCNSDGGSQVFRGEDDDEEYEEDGRGSRFLGFMFGNVDDSGDLDVDYLDEDAKKHFAALSEELGPAFTDMDMSVKLPRTLSDAVEQDYDEKAENAVNYFDIDEDFEGPEIEGATEEDHLLPRDEYLSAKVSVDKIREVEHEVVENYDEESEQEKEQEVVEQDVRISPPLPVLCIEDGEVILRFSEIFGTHGKEAVKRNRGYSVCKSMHKSMDVTDIVEEDEEAFLKGTGEGFTALKEADGVKHNISELNDDDLEFAKFRVHKEATSFAVLDGPGKGTYLFAAPMKEDLDVDLCVERQSPSRPTFYPLDQQDWEDGIIWDKSPVMSDNAVESCEMSGPDHTSVDSETESDSGSQNIQLESQKESDEKRHDIMLFSRSSLLEPFGSRNSAGPLCVPVSESRYHPQLLRLESRFEVDDQANGRMENVDQKLRKRDAVRQFSKLTSHNRDMLKGSWLDQIIWDPNMPIRKPKLILDLEDEQMLFEILDSKDSEHLKLHSGATIVTPPLKSSNEDSLDLPSHGAQFCWRYVANDKHYANRKTSYQLKSNSKRRTAQSIKIYHSQPALRLQTMKLKLSNKEVANFHRPKALWYPCNDEKAVKELGKLPTQGPTKIIIKSLGGKGSKLHVDHEETVFSVKAKASKKLDFKSSETVRMFYKGKELEDDKSLAAQNVQRNSLLYLVRTKIYLLPRSQKLPGENKSLRPPGAFKKKSDPSAKDGRVFLVEYCEERPLLLSNIGMGARLCTYYQNSAPDDQNGSLLHNESSSLGHVISLNPADKSPFLGDTKAGCCQSSLETNMYRAPLFSHKVPSTDYLLVRSAKGKLSIRRIDKLNVVGQQEPLMKVMSPGTKNLKNYMLNRLIVYMCREFRAAEEHHVPPCIRVDELCAQFPYLSDPFIKNKVKELVNLPKGSSGHWVKKSNFRIFSEDELRNMVKPEEVCAYESMQAGLYRLKHLRITQTHPSVMSSAMSHLRDEGNTLAPASHIERELQTTPWNLSCNFVACTMGKENIERLEISGLGDPSGRGLGFSYVRAAPKSSMSNAVGKKNCATGRGRSDSFSRERCQEIWEQQVRSLSAAGSDKNESDSEGNYSDLDSFAGSLENLLDAEECEKGLGGDHEFECDKADDVKGLVMRRLLSLNPAEESEDEAAEAAELCRLLMGDETERKKKKKTRVLEEAGLPPGSRTSFGFQNADTVKQNIVAPQFDGSYTPKEKPIGESKVMENLLKRSKTGELKWMKENATKPMHKKLNTSGVGVKMCGEKKPVRENFVCGACGQHGHMRTNKNCPKFGKDLKAHIETPDVENVLGKSIPLNSSSRFQQKTTTKKLIPETVIDVEGSGVENLGPTSKVVPLTFKVALGEKFPDKQAPGETESYRNPVTSDLEAGNPAVKVSKIIISNKTKPGEGSVESHKPPIGIWSPTDIDRGHVKSQKPLPTIVIRPPATTVGDQVESQKPSVAKLPLVEAHKEQHHQKRHEKQNSMYFSIEAVKKKARDDRRLREEQEKRRIEESTRRLYDNEIRMAKEQERLAELKKYEAAIKQEREEELQKVKKNKIMNRRPQINDDYLEDSRTRTFGKRMPQRNQGAKRRPTVDLGSYGGDYAPTTKRRKGGEVGLANILERIVESLKDRIEISYLFLKPVSKKEAPDYRDIIKHPMDLSTIKVKVRNMEYKSREQFRRDVWQIAFNAHKYNDEHNPDIPPLADQLLNFCDYMLVENEESLTEAEAGIEYADI
ncbi:transcription initiation factor TFIID subunit 1-like [Rosa rugosa]|uniref:transcription initiation factor TFIID subunit 1-like n=1 Tax=Rosa rugosa TaxID=74645 RepID=UPI002B4060B7|nr:transcription initiation factor TFIID subunit 1-like [Rosa rugosa]